MAKLNCPTGGTKPPESAVVAKWKFRPKHNYECTLWDDNQQPVIFRVSYSSSQDGRHYFHYMWMDSRDGGWSKRAMRADWVERAIRQDVAQWADKIIWSETP